MALAQITLVENEITVDVSGVSLLAPMVSAATASAALAAQWANEDEDVVVAGGEYSAKHYMAKAQTAETGAVAAAASVTGITAKLSAIETLGRPIASPPVSGAGVAANTYIFATPVVETGVIEQVRAWGLTGGGTLKLRKFDRSGDTFTQSGSDVNVVLTAGAALKTVAVSLAVTAGQYVGYYVPASLISRTTTTTDSGGFYSPAVAADSTSFTDDTPATTLRHEIGIDITYQSVTATREAQQDSDIDALQVTVSDHEGRLDTLEGGVVRQVIGRQGTPVTGTAALAANTYALKDAAIGDGRISAVRLFTSGSGTLVVKVFEEADGVLTQVGSDESFDYISGLNTLPCDISISKGQRVGWYNSTANLRRSVATGYSGGYDSTAGNVSTLTASATPAVANQLEIGFDLDVTRTDRWVIDIRNSDRVIVLGDSFSQSSQTHRGKSWLAKVSLFSDWCFDNFGVAGDTATENLARIRANTATLGVLPYRDRSGTYALIYAGQNDAAAYPVVGDFIADMVNLIETVKGLGATPILVAPHSLDAALYGQGFDLIYRNLAEEHGCYFVDVSENARVQDYGARYGGFWNGTHPGVRTNQIIVGPVERLFNELEAPRQSMKLFRKRSGVAVTTVADLIFNTHYERAKLFKEILIGTGALNTAGELIYDELGVYDGPTHSELLNSEYEALQNGDSIALDDYSLLEVTLPTTAKHIDQLTLTLNVTDATVYCRGILTGTVVDGTPLGTWIALNGGSGVYHLSNSELKRFMRQDKLSFLIVKTGGIASFTEPQIEWIGPPVLKPRKVGKTQGRRALGAELLGNPDLGVSTSWTATGTVSHGAPADACLPIGSTGRVTVDNTNYVSQAVTYAADNERAREVEIRINARRFPGIDDGSVTVESFDWAMLQIEVGTGAGRIPYREKVGLWWGDIVLRTIAPLGTTGLTLYIRGASGSPAIEASKASFRFVDA